MQIRGDRMEPAEVERVPVSALLESPTIAPMALAVLARGIDAGAPWRRPASAPPIGAAPIVGAVPD